MSSHNISNLPASVRQRLLNLSHQRREDYQLVLSQFATERLLYRLTKSPYLHEFVLKGAVLFALWTGELHRPTYDLDLLGYGAPTVERLKTIFGAMCAVDVEPDGIVFDPDSVRVISIREGQEYGGLRVTLSATLGTIRIPLQIDVGFGDVVVPQATIVTYPTLLDFPAPRLRAYSRETVVAEKLHAMVVLGMLNSRMKDFYDLWTLLHKFSFDGELLSKAIVATFERRQTPLPSITPVALTERFYEDIQKNTQWTAFLRRNKLQTDEIRFSQVIIELNHFLTPVLQAVRQSSPFIQFWQLGGPWTLERPHA